MNALITGIFARRATKQNSRTALHPHSLLKLCGAGAIAVAMVAPSVVHADSQYWLGNQSDPLFASIKQGSFFDANNWNNTVVPGSTDDVYLGINSAGDTFNTGSPNSNFSYSPHYINFGDFQLSAGFVAGGNATVANFNVVAGLWTLDMGSGSYDGNHNPPTSTGSLTATAGFRVGGTNGAQPTLTLANGTLNSNISVGIGVGGGVSGNATVDGPNSLWTSSAGIGVGTDGGQGGLTISNGGVMKLTVAGSFNIGSGSTGATGIVTVTGAGSSINDTSKDDFNLGTTSGNSGTLILADHASVTDANNNFFVGRSGKGTLSISGGAHLAVQTGDILIARDEDGSIGAGTATVSGPGSLLSGAGDLYIGGTGKGSLSVLDGGTVTIQKNAYVGTQSSSSEQITVSGANSSLSIGKKLMIWQGSTVDVSDGEALVGGGALPITTGTLRVGSGGTVSGGGTIIGSLLNDGGTVAPADDPETLTINGDFTQTTGTTRMEVGGPNAGQFDQLIVTGTADLGGTFELDLINGYLPSPGSTFDLFDFNAVAPGSQFSAIILPSGTSWDTSDLLTTGTITFTGSAVPEPTSLGLLGLGGLALLRRANKRNAPLHRMAGASRNDLESNLASACSN